MNLSFHKYQGTGNDFVMIDHRTPTLDITPELIQRLCDRRFGIGADGLILIEEHSDLDFHMIYYNADGSQSFCGNGSRCAVAFCARLGRIGKHTRFLATDGVHQAVITGTERVKLAMHEVTAVEENEGDYYLNTGSPHFVRYVADVEAVDVKTEGEKVRYDTRFKAEGINVNFVQETEHGIRIRTYERGVEGETLSCGTGVTAAAITAHLRGVVNHGRCFIETKGGRLEVQLKKAAPQRFYDLWLEGPGNFVYEGSIPV